jgi:hypothetical protein
MTSSQMLSTVMDGSIDDNVIKLLISSRIWYIITSQTPLLYMMISFRNYRCRNNDHLIMIVLYCCCTFVLFTITTTNTSMIDAYSIRSIQQQQQQQQLSSLSSIQSRTTTSITTTITTSMYGTSPTRLLLSSNVEPNTNSNSNLSYGERSRIYRRDVFNYDSWVEHRSTDRFVGNIFDILKSGVFRQLVPSCIYICSIAFFVIVYNALCVTGYDDFNGIHHNSPMIQYISFPLLKIPTEFFNLCTPSLALLLGMCVLSF